MPVLRPCLLALAILSACSRPPPAPEPAAAPTAPVVTTASVALPPPAPATAGAQEPAGAATAPAPVPATATIPPTPASAATPAPKPVALTAAALVLETAVLRSSGEAGTLAPEGETVVEPDARFRIDLREASGDARLLLLDGADAAVPSRTSHEIGDATRLTLSPSEPLTPGGHYVLRVDGAVGRELHAGDRSYAPALYALKVAGEPPPPPPPRAKKKAKRSRR